jgi:adenine-specific DNA-methyltransferase
MSEARRIEACAPRVPRVASELTAKERALGQFPTPPWLAERIVERFYGDLGARDLVLEPSCHLGAFLQALPAHVPAVGVEIDSEIARAAEALTGRRVLCGDFRTVELTETPTCILGNPPFKLSLIEAFLARARALLPEDGRLGFVLPAFAFQTSTTTLRLTDGWRVEPTLIPRDVYPRLKLPLLFAQFRKSRARTLVGFAFHAETAAVNALPSHSRQALRQQGRSVWTALVLAALDALGGQASLAQIYAWAEGRRPTANAFWRPKIRQTLQRHCVPIARGVWARSPQLALAA